MTNPTLHEQVPASSAVLKAIREANMQLVRTGDDAFMLVTLKQAAPQQEAQGPVAWRELCRRLYVELFHCNQQMTGGVRPMWQQGKMVRDVLADAKAALDAAPQPSPAVQGDALDAAFEAVRKRLCKLPRYSFALDSRSNLRRCEDKSGNWIEFDAVHALFDPVAIDAAIAAQGGSK